LFVMSGTGFAMLQAPAFHGLAFDLLPLVQDGVTAAEANIGR